jgi:hypothetical protein
MGTRVGKISLHIPLNLERYQYEFITYLKKQRNYKWLVQV